MRDADLKDPQAEDMNINEIVSQIFLKFSRTLKFLKTTKNNMIPLNIRDEAMHILFFVF